MKINKGVGFRAAVVAGMLGAAVLCMSGAVFAGPVPAQRQPGPGAGPGGSAPTGPDVLPPTVPSPSPTPVPTSSPVAVRTPVLPLRPRRPVNPTCALGTAWLDLLGRPMDSDSLAQWQGWLMQGGDFEQYIQVLVNSDEFRTDEIQQLYQQFLNRQDDPAALQSALLGMQQGGTINGVAASILGSDEFYAAAGASDAGWVNTMYKQLLGRMPSGQEAQGLLGQLSAGASRQSIAQNMLSSSEYLNGRINGWFQLFINRTPGSDELHEMLVAVQQGEPLDQVEASIFTSPAFLSLKACGASRPEVPGN